MNFDGLCRLIALTACEQERHERELESKRWWAGFSLYLLTWSFEAANADMRSLNCTLSQLVRARDEEGARHLAGAHAGDEGKEFWLDPTRSVCRPVSAKGPPEYLHVAQRPVRPPLSAAEESDFARILRRVFIRREADYVTLVKYTLTQKERDVVDFGLTQGWLSVNVPEWSYDVRYFVTEKGREELSALPDEEPGEPVVLTYCKWKKTA